MKSLQVYRGKRVLVTGHTGFKGSWLTSVLLNLGAKVIGFSNGIPTNPSHFEALGIENEITHVVGDVRSSEELGHVFQKYQPEFVFHLAAQAIVRESFDNPRETFETNIMGTVNLLEQIRLHRDQVRVAVIATSDKCYENVEWIWGYRENDPLGGKDPYSASKAAAELATKSYMHSFFNESCPAVATTRAGNVIGGGDWAKDRIVPDIARAYQKGEKVFIRNPSSTRPWQHVLEPIVGYLRLGAGLLKDPDRFRNQAYNFGPSPSSTQSVKELLEEFQKHWQDAPGWSTNQEMTHKEAGLLRLNIDKVSSLLNWTPQLNFEETIALTAGWYQAVNQNIPVKKLTNQQIEDYLTEKRVQFTI